MATSMQLGGCVAPASSETAASWPPGTPWSARARATWCARARLSCVAGSLAAAAAAAAVPGAPLRRQADQSSEPHLATAYHIAKHVQKDSLIELRQYSWHLMRQD